jgi:hypothetical protein
MNAIHALSQLSYGPLVFKDLRKFCQEKKAYEFASPVSAISQRETLPEEPLAAHHRILREGVQAVQFTGTGD